MMKQVNKSNSLGFTIIEVLVSSVLMTFLMISAVLFLRRGRDIEARDFQRRTARQIIENQFEMIYNYSNYNNIKPGDPNIQNTSVHNITYTCSTDIQSLSVSAGNNIQINGRRITSFVIWYTHAGTQDTLELTKWIADIQ